MRNFTLKNDLIGLSLGAFIVLVPLGITLIVLDQQHEATWEQANTPATHYNVGVKVVAEFQLHGQECTLLSINTRPCFNCELQERATMVDCGHGLDPHNPLPPDGGASDWDYPRFGMR